MALQQCKMANDDSQLHPVTYTYTRMHARTHFVKGSPFTAVEPEHQINDVCYLQETGMIFMACEDSKMLSYYIPVSIYMYVCGTYNL